MPAWRDPRTYPDSLDPLEFALSILNETTDRSVEGGNDLRDDGLPGFAEVRPKLIEHLDRIVRGLPSTLTLEVSSDVGVPLRGLVVQPTKPGARFLRSLTQNSKADHRWMTLTTIWLLLDLPGYAERKARLCRCSYCGRFFLHSQKRKKRVSPCSPPCKTGEYLDSRTREKHAEYMRELRKRRREHKGVVSVSRSFQPKKITISI